MQKNMWKVFVSVIVIVLASLACSVPDVGSLVNPLPSDDFSDDRSGWGTGTSGNSSVDYNDGGFKITIFQPYFVSWSTPDISSYENIHLEVSLENESFDPEALVGFVCNEQGSTGSFYYAGITPAGYYAFIKAAVAQDDVMLKQGQSDIISANSSSMRLGLDCANGSMTLYVNGQMIDSVTDSSYPSGSVGLFAASDDQSNGASVIFDDFVVTKLGE